MELSLLLLILAGALAPPLSRTALARRLTRTDEFNAIMATCPTALRDGDAAPRLLASNHKTGTFLASKSGVAMCDALTAGWWSNENTTAAYRNGHAPPLELTNRCCGVGLDPHWGGRRPSECAAPRCRVVNFARNPTEVRAPRGTLLGSYSHAAVPVL